MTCAGARLAAAALMAASLVACGGAAPRTADLVHDVRSYGNGLRWRDFAAAALSVAPARREDFLDRCEHLDSDLRIADWEMTRLEYDDTRNRAEVQIEYTWLLDSRGIVHTTVTRQSWSRHGDRWIIDREVRLRGKPMPGVPEPHADQPDADEPDVGEPATGTVGGQDAGNTVNRSPDPG